jgi:aromatic-L-amino-acid decarboxylase
MTMRCDGLAALQGKIRNHVTWAQELARWVAQDDRFEIVAPHPLNLVCVALRAGDDATERLIEVANSTGEALFTRTVLDGRTVLRFCIGSRTTERRHVEAGWGLLTSLVERVVS